jgi:hypothetical protein
MREGSATEKHGHAKGRCMRLNVSFCSVWVLNERLDCKCSSKVSIYTRGRGQEDDDDDPQLPL